MKKSDNKEPVSLSTPKRRSGAIKKENLQESVPSSSKIQTPEKKDDKLEEDHKWWEREPRSDGKYWDSLKHNGPNFPPPYQRLPAEAKFFYDGKEVRLSENAEEVAGFYAELLDKDCTTAKVFKNNFFADWRRVMTEEERSRITVFEKCNFNHMQRHCQEETKKMKQKLDKEKQEKYGFCITDGYKQQIYNCTVELPGIFYSKTNPNNPNNGKIKKRIQPEDVTINCSADAKPDPPPGHHWKDVTTNPRATWLAKWTDTLQNKEKYMKFHYSSPLKGNKDWEKYQEARSLHDHINKIRDSYKEDWKSEDIKIQQRGVALYFIDMLAFRAGHEKGEDTVGCCSLRVEHIKLDEDCVVSFDFHEKGFGRYKNKVTIDELPFKNLQKFIENKGPKDNLFDRIDGNDINNHLNTFMDGLTAKVFRLYNASLTFQQELDELTRSLKSDATPQEKVSVYKKAALAAATLCNHQRTGNTPTKPSQTIDVTEQLQQLSMTQLKEETKITDSETTKLYYLDPRITVAWCKANGVPIEKIFTTKKERDTFKWAIERGGPDYHFENTGANIRKKLF